MELNRSKSRLKGLMMFAAMAGVLVIALVVLNWLPTAFQKETIRLYRSMDEVRVDLDIKDIYVPSYFPQSFGWPPSRILAQGKPFHAVLMEFADLGDGSVGLVITQTASGELLVKKKIEIAEVKETIPYKLKGRDAVLVVGSCGNDIPCSRISWSEGRFNIDVVARTTPFELITIAESMLR
jgi:hypothetical protein